MFEKKNENELKYDFLVKILLIGSSGVGKSSISNKFVKQEFITDTISTIGVDLKIKTIKYKDKLFKCQLWDTAGHERFKSITSSYYRGSDCAIVVFDLTNKDSFKDLSFWLQEIKNHNETILYYLVGNKCDLIEKRKNKSSDIEKFIIENNIDNYIEVSAKNNTNIEILFKNIVVKFYELNKTRNKKEKAILPPSLLNKKIKKQIKEDKFNKQCCFIS